MLSRQAVLVELDQLARMLDEGRTQVLDIRPGDRFAAGHIPGAIHLPELFSCLPMTTPQGLDAFHAEFEALLRERGVRPDGTLVIVEDSLETWYGGSCRGCWLLRYFGHPDVRVLERGFMGWEHRGFSVSTEAEQAPGSDFRLRPVPEMLIRVSELEKRLGNGTFKLVDNRDRDEWEGHSSSPYGVDFAPRKGRISGAIWVEWYRLMEQGLEFCSFKSPETIRDICAQQGLFPDDDIVLYCFKGARSANSWVALQLAGFSNVRLYLGSWNEWSRSEDLPVENPEGS